MQGANSERDDARSPGPVSLTALAGGRVASPTSRRAFGHTLDRSGLVGEEADAIRDAVRRVLDGDTLSSIVGEWNLRGLATANGGPWRVNSLSSLLLQSRLAGLATDSSPEPPGRYPPIIDVASHERLVALHATRRKGPRRETRQYLLTGMLRCWRCGGSLRGMPRTRGADLYVCPGPPHGGCSGTAITADHADDAVRDLVLDRLDSPVFSSPSTLPEPDAGAGSADRPEAADAALRLAGHRQRLAELADMWASGEISREEWVTLKRKLGGRAKEAEAQVARRARVDSLQRLAGRGQDLRQQWATMAIEERRAIVRAALDHVVVLAAEPPKQVFRPERLEPRWLG